MYSESEFLCGLSDSNGAFSTSQDPDFISNRALVIALLRSGESSLTVDPSPLHESARHLEIRILELENLIVRLQAEKQQIRSCLNAQRSLMAPVRRIPVDVLLHIFKLVCMNERSTLLPQGPPWVLGQVCCWWRNIVTTYPILWSSIRGGLKYLTSRTPEILQRALELSCECPLHLELDLYGNGSYDETFVRQVVALIVHNSSRWESVIFTWTPRILPLFSGVYGRLPLLRSLRATFQNVWSIVQGPLYSFFSVAPSLTEMKTSGLAFQSFPVPVSQLKSFHGCFSDVREVHDLLGQIPGLLNFGITNVVLVPDKNNSPPIFHEHIRTITCRGDVLKCLGSATFPALEEIDGEEHDWTDEAVDIADRITQRSCCSIRTFRAGVIYPFARLFTLSSIKLSLTALTLLVYKGRWDMTDHVGLFNALAVNVTSHCLLPFLRELTLKDSDGCAWYGSPFFCPEFFRMVQSRWIHPAPAVRLERLTLVVKRHEYVDLKPRDVRLTPLWVLQQEGLAVRVMELTSENWVWGQQQQGQS
ncbi:hypothetical protein EV421DRAFT_1823506 [Armillaria borealis]|uniref:F-box domain-containing protein n=1 Tax=Armillaria borealis TaxID=47425 RepID=A0AA39J9U6_9AGAR|nr:hypothetical protein EV421DRAFT_1823506 [Armillaria borealis]